MTTISSGCKFPTVHTAKNYDG